jgi:hypothetical protein
MTPTQEYPRTVLWLRDRFADEAACQNYLARLRQRVLGLGSYRTAWNLLHKLRRAMVRPGRERLNGIVEVDEPRPGKRGRGARGKMLVVVAAQQAGEAIGRIVEKMCSHCVRPPMRKPGLIQVLHRRCRYALAHGIDKAAQALSTGCAHSGDGGRNHLQAEQIG